MSKWNRYEQLIQQGKLPSLKITRIENILLHERVETDRADKLKTRIELSGMLQNPLICAALPDSEKLILLDGAHRYTALTMLKCRYVPVQIVDYDDPYLEIKKWRHLFLLGDEKLLFDTLELIVDVRIHIEKFSEHATFYPITPGFCAQVILKSGRSVLITGPKNIEAKIGIINTLSSLYLPDNLVDRISYDDFDALENHYRKFTGLIIYPRFSKEEIIQIALNHHKLPTGITRHIIPKRALHVNLPLSMLRFTDEQEEVENFLMDFIDQKIKNKAIRFYTESTFLFDD